MSDWLEAVQVVNPDHQVLGEILLPQHVIELGQKKGHIILCNPNTKGWHLTTFIFLLRKIGRARHVLIAPEGFAKTPIHKLPQRFTPKEY
jgi:hypothetical protein